MKNECYDDYICPMNDYSWLVIILVTRIDTAIIQLLTIITAITLISVVKQCWLLFWIITIFNKVSVHTTYYHHAMINKCWHDMHMLIIIIIKVYGINLKIAFSLIFKSSLA